ncbi:glutamine amidotransferase [Corynebacterium sp. sy017]|uniref:type 1 glutamine amidotransferase n=1 Tax=unclassified Corynebacterium TaxID=2624378 RepID=UPI001184AA79|nr:MULTISPECIES: glutamine amidotransferase [unclassified Corynebacterium]MBP3089427.1 glutamine amidotransferase [Corynebacterium sp. sy017]QDZ43350.1 glutamine amidotransferase [Corynebacterium sp. sy039]TSD90887.1 glutamine amidotransferase [Corynebacterium sp. SY003]
MSTLSIGLVLPDVLGTYGDDGNALVLRQRARMRGIDAEIVTVHLGQAVPEHLDLYCLGGGEDTAQILAVEHLAKEKGLQRAVRNNAPVLAICAGFQILGESFRAGGKIIDGLGLIDATTVSMQRRAIGEVRSTPALSELSEPLTGFENHMGATILGADATALGTVSKGIGNADAYAVEETGAPSEQKVAEGAIQGSVLGTYMHGPVLARNPELADLLLARALGTHLEPLDLPVVDQLRKERLAQ